MKENEQDKEQIESLINEPGDIGEEVLPQVDAGKSDKVPWDLAADKMKRKVDRGSNGQEKFRFGAGL